MPEDILEEIINGDYEIPRSISLENGKYEIVEDPLGQLMFIRHGEPWIAAQERLEHSSLIYCMFHQIHCLLRALQNAQR